jgi:CheY-like chemotaxis protein
MSSRILVIEDNPLNMKLFVSLLRLDGYEIATADQAENGLLLAHQQVPDLVLMDVQLPGMDGLTATRRMKADPVLQHVPVVALTADAMPGDREKAMDAGCTGYITKPIDTRSFRKTVAEYLSQR